MASVMYFCPTQNCEESNEDPRIIINHCLEKHVEIVSICHEPGCEGKLFRKIRTHTENMHLFDPVCDLCDPPKEFKNYSALYDHQLQVHRQQMGYAEALPPAPTTKLDIKNTMDFFIVAPTLQFIPLRENFGVLYDEKMERTVMGVEILYPDALQDNESLERPIDFKQNLNLPVTQVTTEAIKALGFNSGHVIPCADWSSNVDDFNATFDNANLVAMVPQVNQGAWKAIEGHIRRAAKSSWATVVFTIIHYTDEPPKLSLSKRVHIPGSFTKLAYLNKGDGNWVAQIFNVKNEAYDKTQVRPLRHRITFEDLKTLPMGDTVFTPFTLTWEEEKKTFRCAVKGCFKAFYNYQQLVVHNATHPEHLRCRRCDRYFETKEMLAAHHLECELHCQYCGKRFLNVLNLANHERTHTGDKPYVCTIDGCDARFTARIGLNAHIKSYHEPRQFRCSECPLEFALRSQLSSHRWTHFNVKRYKCSECDQSCSEKSNVQRHINRRHGGVGSIIESAEWKEFAKERKAEEKEARAMEKLM